MNPPGFDQRPKRQEEDSESTSAGLERAPEAFISMLEGRNFGKLIVRVDA